jgi:HAD superfamily hydrolase (TIGR01509 family)
MIESNQADMFEAVLFDLDGTLVDFIDTDSQILQLILANTGSDVPFTEFLQTSIDVVTDFHQLVIEQKIDPLTVNAYRLKRTFDHFNMDWEDDYVDFYRRRLVELCEPYPGVVELLTSLRRKVKTGLITNAYEGAAQRKRIEHAGLQDHFDVIVVAGERGVRKPDPAIFLHTLEQLGVTADQALYIGDSEEHDIVGARAAGMLTVKVAHDGRPESEIADYCVQGIQELHVLLDQLL